MGNVLFFPMNDLVSFKDPSAMFGNFHHDVTTVLQNYFHYCALKMSCVELSPD